MIIGAPLGKKTIYKDTYDPTLLFPIERKDMRQKILAETSLKGDLNIFEKGFDIWNCYEFSWLSSKGKPEVRILTIFSPAFSSYIVESKSVKLYLKSFHNTVFNNEEEVISLIKQDLSKATGAEVIVVCKSLTHFKDSPLQDFAGKNIDDIDIEIENFVFDRNLLKPGGNIEVEEVLTSNLLKANCLVTGQPDWGSVQISYKGQQINHEALLKYLVSFRNYNEFAEPWVERALVDILDICKPIELTIYAKFTRRGGIDINPIRSTSDLNVTDINNFRHIRQ